MIHLTRKIRLNMVVVQQRNHHFLRSATLCGGGLIACCLLLTGCGRETNESTEINSSVVKSQVTPAAEKNLTTTVAPSKADTATSPATAADALPPTDAEPAKVCQRFLELLQSGNRITAENLLTRTALTVTSKAGLQLEPMGSPQARYQIGTTRYATIKNDLAQIDCEVIDQVNGQETRSTLTWMLRRQNLGWRIAGLLIQLNPGQPEDFLSFENIQDVQKIKNLASASFDDQLEARQANASSNVSTEGNNLK